MPLSDLRPGNRHTCPLCGATVTFSGQDGSKVQEAIDRLARDTGGVSVKVNVRTRISRPWWKFWGT